MKSYYVIRRKSIYIEKVIVYAKSEKAAREAALHNKWIEGRSAGIADVVDLDFHEVLEVGKVEREQQRKAN